MDKPIAELIADLKNICTNDPAMQSRIVKVFEAMLGSLESKEDRPIKIYDVGRKD